VLTGKLEAGAGQRGEPVDPIETVDAVETIACTAACRFSSDLIATTAARSTTARSRRRTTCATEEMAKMAALTG